MKIRLCSIFFVLASSVILGKIEITKMILPTPQVISVTNNVFILDNDLTIGISDNSLEFHAKQIQSSLLNRFGIKSNIAENGNINLNLVNKLDNIDVNEQLLNQAYTLIITDDK